eukprot:6174856-Pleurochrysis_carterae.AAC.1
MQGMLLQMFEHTGLVACLHDRGRLRKVVGGAGGSALPPGERRLSGRGAQPFPVATVLCPLLSILFAPFLMTL